MIPEKGKRYVIRIRADAVQPAGWCPVTREKRAWESHHYCGQYVMDGGHHTRDLQDAKVFRGETVLTGRAWHARIHELVEVELVEVLPTVYRGKT